MCPGSSVPTAQGGQRQGISFCQSQSVPKQRTSKCGPPAKAGLQTFIKACGQVQTARVSKTLEMLVAHQEASC